MTRWNKNILVMGCLFAILSPAIGQNKKKNVTAVVLPQVLLNKSEVPPGDYSGISPIKDNLYAVVSDKEPLDGFYPFTITIDSINGKIKEVHRNGAVGHQPSRTTINGYSTRDAEDIVYHPSTDTYFISGEGDQRILEFSKDGQLTGRELHIPKEFSLDSIQPNKGFESLAYDAGNRLFWSTTEAELKKDMGANSDGSLSLRLQAFGDDLKPLRQYAYRTDVPSIKPLKARQTFGVSAITVLPDGRLLVLERDFVIPKNYIRSYVRHKIYLVDPLDTPQDTITSSTDFKQLSPTRYLKKELVAEFQTNLKVFERTIANYEGMCLGPVLKDGRQALLLINDSQHNYGNLLFHLQDYLKVILLKFQ